MTNTQNLMIKGTNYRVGSKATRLCGAAARRARVVLVTALVAAGLLLPSLAAGLVAPPAHASTPFVVNSTSDLGDPNPNDGQCVIPDFSGVDHCTLRAAIQNANGTPGPDVIDFAIPSGQSTKITPGSFGSTPLPEITDQVTIDGYSQTEAKTNTKTVGDDAVLKIELDGSNVPNAFGLVIENSSNSIIRGLDINRFSTGIAVAGDSVGNRIEGNFIGTDPTGTIDRGNAFHGVLLAGGPFGSPSKTVVGGPTPDKRNIISANHGSGVKIAQSNLSRIEGNYVGTDGSGTEARGNDNGIVIENAASGTTVGGTTAASRNVISGNDLSGIVLDDSQGTSVLGNRIGTAANGNAALGNQAAGVTVGDSSDNKIGDGTPAGSNTIAFNGQDGVEVFAGSTGNAISRNSVFSNAGLGLDLVGLFESFDTNVSTPNDGDNPNTQQVDPDSDTGPNNLQNFPVLTSAGTSSTATTVKGKLNNTPGTSFAIEFFSNPAGTDEGKTFIGTKSVTTDASGNASFSFQSQRKVAVGRAITATATNTSTKDTSEFSSPVIAKDAAAPGVKSLSPTNNATGVSPTANVTAVFTEAMDSSTINATTVKLKKAGTTKSVSATVTYDASAKKATLDPASSLARGAKYVATVVTVAKDLAGNTLDQNPNTAGNQAKVWSFTVKR